MRHWRLRAKGQAGPFDWNSRLLASGNSALRNRLAGNRFVKGAFPWLLPALTLIWGWHRIDLLHAIPAYGDVLEGIWLAWWYNDALRLGISPELYQLAVHPAGLHVATFAWGPSTLLLMLPLYWVGGGAFAYNVATLISFIVAFGGMYLLGRRFTSRLGATVAAFLYTFWGFRWYSIIGQLNVSLGSALLPWMLFCLERAYHSPRRQQSWYSAAGLVWALSASSSLYFVLIDAVAFSAWLVGHLWTREINWRKKLWRCLLAPLAAGLLSLPVVVWFWRASNAAGARSFSVYDVNALGTSLNALPMPNLQHPWWNFVGHYLYGGAHGAEVASTSLGPLACLVAVIGLGSVWRRADLRPLFVLASFGLLLSLGLTLRWNDQTVQWPAVRPINQIVWGAVHFLRPTFFVGRQPPAPFTDAILMPGTLVTALLPGFESARVFARYAFLLGLAMFLLAGVGLTRLRSMSLRLAVAALLIFEAVPPPVANLPFPPASHPAFDWLRRQNLQPQGIMELRTTSGYRLEMPNGGDAIYATIYHGQSTTSWAGSIVPASQEELANWLVSHSHPFQDPEFLALLGYFKLRYVVLYMTGGWQSQALEEARDNQDLSFVQCFPAGAGPRYTDPICILEYRPTSPLKFNFLLREGWSGAEDWGRWIDGTTAKAVWIGTAPARQQVTIQVFPQCVENQHQHLWLEVNGTAVGEHQWNDCEPWTGQISIPPELVRIGANELLIRAAYSSQPNGSSHDPRELSLGVSQLLIQDGQ